jgi:hypothetical protein
MCEPAHVPELGAPVFFVSHAHGDNGEALDAVDDETNRRHIRRFFKDLSTHVRQLLGLRAGPGPGFIDDAMAGGERWTDELLTALRTAAVFVPLLSADYVQSPWCSKEWDGFNRRTYRPRPNSRRRQLTPVVPVLWSRFDLERLHPHVRAVQTFTPQEPGADEMREAYRRHGIYGLLTINSPHYDLVAWSVAQRIFEVCAHVEVEYGEPLGEQDLRDAFELEARKWSIR